MKKLRVGSFPLIEIPAQDRKCLDRYLIKTFSDNISINDAIRNLNITKGLFYITPDSLMRDWLNGRSNSGIRRSPSSRGEEIRSDRYSGYLYDEVLKGK
jgi:hypothetical protein